MCHDGPPITVCKFKDLFIVQACPSVFDDILHVKSF